MVLLLAWMMVSVLLPVSNSQDATSGELVPGFLLADSLAMNEGTISLGMPADDARRVLGSRLKVIQKAKRYSTAKLLDETRLAESLAPQFPRLHEKGREIAARCGDCWIEIVAVKIGRKDEIRLQLRGPTKDKLAVDLIVVDHDRALIRRWRSDFIRDRTERAAYFLTDDGTFRVSYSGVAVRIESVK